MKRTDMITFMRGDAYRVYKDEKDGRLYYREYGHWCGTFPCYCTTGKPTKKLKR